MVIIDMLTEGTLSQILNLSPSLYFYKLSKMMLQHFRKYFPFFDIK